jgi:hypothetical protein
VGIAYGLFIPYECLENLLDIRQDSTQEQDYIPVAKYRRYFARERSTPPASSSRALVGLKTAFSTPDKGQA